MTFAKRWRQNRTQACKTGMNNGKKFYPIQSLIINFIRNKTDVTRMQSILLEVIFSYSLILFKIIHFHIHHLIKMKKRNEIENEE